MKRAPFWFLALVACGGAPASPSAPSAGSASLSAKATPGDLPAASLLPRPTFDLPAAAGPAASLADVLRASRGIVVGTVSDIHAMTRPCAVDLVVDVRPEMQLLGEVSRGPEQRRLLVSFPRAAEKEGCERSPLRYRGAPALSRFAVGQRLVFFVGGRREAERDPALPAPRWHAQGLHDPSLDGDDLLGVADVDEIPAIVRQRGPLVTDAQLAPLAGKPSFRVQGDVAIDAATGLAWQRDVAKTELGIVASTRHCENLVLGGHDDWRLPRSFELASIVDHGRGSPALDPAVFRGPPEGLLWASTEDAGAPWVLDVADGNLHSTHYDDPSPYGKYNVRCVRSAEGPSLRAALPFARYRRAGGLVEDALQRLAFSGAIAAPMRWAEANTFCAAKVEAGHDDFRLPTVRELVTLSEVYDCEELWKDEPEGEDGLWTSTLDPADKSHAFRVRSLCSAQSWAEPTVGPPALAMEGEDHARFRALCVRDLPPIPKAGAQVQSRYPSGHVFAEGALRNGKRHGTWTYHHDQGLPWMRLEYRDGVLDGTFSVFYDSGERLAEGAFAAGAPAGTWTHFDMLGRRASVVAHERGERSGRSTTYTPEGAKVAREETWVRGLRQGTVVEYDEEAGTKTRVAHYEAGLREGAVETFHPNGARAMVGQYRGDKPDGTFTRFHANGARAAVFSFRGGAIDGPYESWHPDGKPYEKGVYRDGLRDGAWTALYPSGKRVAEGHYQRGTGTLREFYENGKPRSEQPQVGGLREGVTVFFREDGSKDHEVGFSRDTLDGIWRDYDPSGRLTFERHFEKGREHGPYVRFHANGQKDEEGSYAHGLHVGPYRSWDEEGRLSEEGEYQGGLRHGTWTDFVDGKPVRRSFYERGVEVRDPEWVRSR
ncbi:DUF1566 domain-containing protein [Polyangium sorediatum]|uniref:DUF1566 domain-containing protein n=1 Tax=Polyangium sorediatum TaxID=889274 RepID=A0ABT6NT96_9BACT|nr:DUF1566 domain-containing protein [Polyangium sorediatum]MDI1431372.1 DUF1566 domain-containing protein [Polyangium sorediatum]